MWTVFSDGRKEWNMKPIKINPELLGVKERLFMGFELWQLFDLLLGFLFSLCMVVMLPDIGMIKGIISALPALPFVIIALKPYYGLRGLKLLGAFIRSQRNNRLLRFEAEGWKRINKKYSV